MPSVSEQPWLSTDGIEIAKGEVTVKIHDGSSSDDEMLLQNEQPKAPAETSYSTDDDAQLETPESMSSSTPSADEDCLREIWADVLDLDLEEVTSESHFFELGGDSLAAAEMVLMASNRGLRLSRELIFAAPTFADMAAVLSFADASPAAQSAELKPFSLVEGDVALALKDASEQCSVSVDDIEDIYPATALQAGLMASSLGQPGTYVSTWALKDLQPLDPMWLCDVMNKAVEKLPILRTALATSTEHAFVQVVLRKTPPVEVIRVSSLENLDPQARRPDISVGTPLTRIEIIAPEEGNHILLLWHAHHAAYDMSTLDLVARHMTDIASGAEVLPSPPSFAAFIQHSIEVRRNPEWRDFWTQQLEGCSEPFFPHARDQVLRTDARYIHPMSQLNSGFAFTVANVVRGAWAFLLSCYENADDVVFGVTNGGRYAPVPQCARIVGPTIATTPMRVRLNGNRTVSDFLQEISVQAVQINAWEQVGLPLIQQLGADAHRATGFRTLVNVQTSDAFRSSQFLAPKDPEMVDPLDYALVLEIFPREGDVTPLSLSYDSNVLRREQVVQIAQQLEATVRFMMNGPDKTLDDIAGVDTAAELLDPSILAPAQLLRIRKHAAVECGVLESVVQEVYPCTPVQAGLVDISLRHPEANISRTTFVAREDMSDADIIESWKTLFKKASTLRTRLFQAPGTQASPSQLQLFQAVIDEEIEWTESNDLQKYLAADRSLSFNFGQPLARFALIRDRDGGRVRWVVMTAHQAVYDPSCSKALLQALGGSEDTSPYSLFLRKVSQSPQDESKKFWTKSLSDCLMPPFPELPAGHSPLTTESMHKEIVLPANSSQIMTQFGSSTVLLAAWAAMMTRYYDSNDVVLGVGMKRLADGLSVLGPTLSNVPLRITMDNLEASVGDFLQSVKDSHLAASIHAQYGFRNIQSIDDDSCVAACGFQNLFVFHDSPDVETPGGARPAFRQLTAWPTQEGKTVPANVQHNFGLVAEASIVKNTAKLTLSFDPSVLEPAQVGRLFSHYEHVLLQLCPPDASQTLRIGSIDHVCKEHLEELRSWTKDVPPPVDRTVHELFEDKARLQPDAPAICARDGEWTFSQLDEISEKLARSLVSLGVGPGVFVPLLFEKCGLTIAVMLAILKAGGASVALDPSHPPERLRNLIAGMGNCLVLCSDQNRDLGFEMDCRVLVVDQRVLKDLEQQPRQPPLSQERPVACDSTAFILFTSGSTGMPKGIIIPHRSFASSIRGHSKTLRFTTGPGSRNFQFTAYTSDVSIGEIFTSLAVGSCVCVPSDWDRKNNLPGSMRELGVNWAFFTPSVATLLGPSEVPGLRTLVFGGETATPDNFRTWSQDLYLINSFGPAECSIWNSCIPRPVTLKDFGSNIGYGLGCAMWITDPTDFNRLMPIGSIGEMLVEGPNLAGGYLNEPVKTAQAFVSNPAWMSHIGRTSMRLYRTGDLARFLPNGMVQFLGRRDHQVKLRGLRIELGEIEHQIRTLLPDDMLVAVDVVNPSPAGSGQILASFIAPKDPLPMAKGQEGSDEKQKMLSVILAESSERFTNALQGLEGALRGVLPTHMVPAAFVPLREMPLTASAKTDRKVLKHLASMITAEELGRLGAATRTKQSPRTIMERILARLWSTALGRSLDLSVHDSFFRVGGDSLSAMRLVSFAGKEGVILAVEQVFKHPTLHEMAEIAILSEHKSIEGEENIDEVNILQQDVTAFALVGDVDAKARAVKSASEQLGVAEDDIEDIYPCTALQEGLVALSQDARGSYVARSVYEFAPNIDLAQFESAWASVIASWPILRTRFFQWHDADGSSRLMQAVVKSKTRWLRSRSLQQYLKLDQRDRMQIGDRMLRLASIRDKNDQKQYFVMTQHHATYDGWMVGLLFAAIRRAYLGLEELNMSPFNVFVNHLAGRDRDSSQGFWQNYIGDASRTTWPELPSLDFRPKSTCVAKRTSSLPPNWQQSFTPTTMVRAAFGILLGAYACTEDVVFASTVYGRALGSVSAEMVAGPTLATLPIRVRLGDRERRLHDLLAELQSDSSNLLAHEQEGMQNIKRFNREALTMLDAQSLLVVQIDQPSHDLVDQEAGKNEKAAELTLNQVNPSGLDNGYLSSALVLEVTVSGDKVHLQGTFDDRVLSSQQVERFLRQMSHLLYQLCNASEDQQVADLDLIPEDDSKELLEWNSSVPSPMQALIHELFTARAKEQPDVEAVVSWEGSLTFRELDEMSDRLAGHLWTSCGIRTGVRVPLLFEKSIWTVVAMLGVLKVGAAYVALNPAHPVDRLKSLVEDVDADFVLCSVENQQVAQDVNPQGFFCVGPATFTDNTLRGENGAQGITPENVAFFLFTSGSTGKPKAIMIDHTAFCSSMRGHGETLCYRKGSRNLQFTAYTSDVSMGEIFTSLTRGATVCIPSDAERMNDLAGAMERMRVDWAFLTPSVASLLNPDHVPTLRTLLFGGESATVTNVQTWAPRLHLINSFGPAETSIWSHAHPHFTVNDDGTDIGWSVGCGTWLVDPNDYNKLMPIGAIGELLVEGPNVAAGYYKNPEKTQAAFMKGLPWVPAGRENNRIYRMGDLARFLPDGRVQFLGRKDGQVKLYGQRIEVGEVEHNIRVALGDKGTEVAVEMIKNPSDVTDRRLMAFISCTPPDQPQDRDNAAIVTDEAMLSSFQALTVDLREKLSKKLAAYMVPNSIVPLTSMPLNASAKTDRKMLNALVSKLDASQLAAFSLSSSREIEPPQSRTEKLLHTMWSTVLGIATSDFGLEADFFECGGDSIAAMKLGSLARGASVSLSVQDIYDHPRLGDLASTLEAKAPRAIAGSSEIAAFSLLPESLKADVDSTIAKASETCSVAVDQIVDIYPCTPTQRALVNKTLSRPGAYWLHNVFEMPAEIDVERLEKAWQLVIAAHAVLRTRIFSVDDQLLQVVLSSTEPMQHSNTSSIQSFLQNDRAKELKYGEPLLRSVILSEDNGQRYFVLTVHHSIYDVWSLTQVFSVLERMYARLGKPADQGNDTSEEYKEVSFKQFVKSVLDRDQKLATDFWTRYLLGAQTSSLAPLEKQSEASTMLRHKIALPSLPSKASKTGSPPRVTHAVMTYAAIALALNNQLQAQDSILRLVSTGRITPVMPDIEELVGPTMTSVPLRIQHSAGNLYDYLAHVQAQVRRVMPFEQTGFDEASAVHAEAEQACRGAPQIIVHPHDPYSEQPAAGLGLRRRELSAFSDDNTIPFTMDVSLLADGKNLQALDLRVVFDNELIPEHRVRRLVAELELIATRISAAMTSGTEKPIALGEVIPTEEDSVAIMELEKQMALIQLNAGIEN